VVDIAQLHPSRSDAHARTGGLHITLPAGSGEKALQALSKPAEFKVGNTHHSSHPIVAPEIARAAIPEMQGSVRPAALAEHQAHVEAQKTGKPFGPGNWMVRIGAALGLAGTAGLAAAAQAPEGEKLTTGAKVAGLALAEGALPGVTQNDMCKSAGSAGAWLGTAVGGVAGAGGAVVVTGATAVPSLGASVAVSPWTTAAAAATGGYIGSEIGEKLGEGGCNMVRAAVNAIRGENRAQMALKPEAGKMVTTAPDATPAGAPAQDKTVSRG
jgi:hypothetical protein